MKLLTPVRWVWTRRCFWVGHQYRQMRSPTTLHTYRISYRCKWCGARRDEQWKR